MSDVAEMTDVIRIHATVVDALLAEARRTPRIECCGLLAGREGVISEILPARNVLDSATAYEIAPAELFALFRRMREERLDHLGIYHSHPATDNTPSPTDVDRAWYPEAAWFILSPQPDAAKAVRAFRIAEGRWTELVVNAI